MRRNKRSQWLLVLALLLAALAPLPSAAESAPPITAEDAWRMSTDVPADIPQELPADDTLSDQPPAGYIDIDYVPPQYVRPQYVRPQRRAVATDAATDEKYITPALPPTRDQGDTGLCWAFSVLGAAEIDLIKQGQANKDEINLSELQLGWFHHKGTKNESGEYNDPLNLFGGDRNDYVLQSGSLGVWGGDNFLLFNRTLSSWIGGTQEDAATAFTPDNINAIRENGLAYDYAFAQDRVHLQDVRMIPSNDMEGMKRAILDHGAVAINYYQFDGYFTPDREYYYSQTTRTNHAVLIVGWDDTISKDLFLPTGEGGTKPARDGAWIIRNSYGDDVHGPEGEKDGYFYMSYETAAISLKSKAVFAFSFEPASNYQHCYQYDGTSAIVRLKYPILKGTTATVREANVFRAQHDEHLKAVSFWMDDHTGLNYKINIYRGAEITAENPTPGEPVATISGNTDYAGYYTLSLPTPLALQAGDPFTVEVQFLNVAGVAVEGDAEYNVFRIPFDKASDGSGIVKCYSYSSAGQSYLYYGDQWVDVSAPSYSSPGNLRIKAFTDETTPSVRIVAPKSLLYVRNGETMQLSATRMPASEQNTPVVWSIIEGGDCAELTKDGLLHTPKKAGTVTVRAALQSDRTIYGERKITVGAAPDIKLASPTNIIGSYDKDSFWVDGVHVPGTEKEGGQIDLVLDHHNASVMTAYEIDAEGIPRGMDVWFLTYAPGTGYTATPQPALKDLLTYQGCSIRVTGNTGIRFRSGISTATKQALTSDAAYHGFRLKECGTLAILASNLESGALPFLRNRQKTSYGEAFFWLSNDLYFDHVFGTQNDRQLFTSVLTNIPEEHYKTDFAFRGYIELTEGGKSYYIYGPPVKRSIYTVATQVLVAGEFPEGSAAYQFVKNIIDVGDSTNPGD